MEVGLTAVDERKWIGLAVVLRKVKLVEPGRTIVMVVAVA
jgi:hypothetical protein